MAGTIIINGRETGRPGVYAIPEYLRLQSRPPLSSILAIVGEFPFLEPGVPYLSTTQNAFNTLSPSSITLKRLSNMIFDASTDSAIQNSPAAVYLVSSKTSTQAFGYLQDYTPTNSIKLSAKQWGTEGNRTYFSIVENATLGGWNYTARNGNYVENNIRIKAEPALMVLEYATPGSHAIPTGFGTVGGGTAGGVTLENTAGTVSVKYEVSFDENFVYVGAAAGNSWSSQAPVDGILTFTASAPATITTGPMTITITGVSKTTGAVVADVLTWSKTDIEAETPISSVVEFTGPVTVRCAVAGGDTFSGEVTISGSVFPDFNAASGYTTVASVITHIANYSSVGFTVSTSSTRSASARLVDLDDLAPDALPAALTADLWKIVHTINSKSILVTAERVGDNPPYITTTPYAFFLAGGTESVATAQTWTNALEELQWYDIDVIAPLYDPTGTDPSEDVVLPLFVDHLNIMWADGANERIAWFPAGTDEDLDELTARTNQFGDHRISMPVDSVSMVQYNNQVEDLDAYWTAVLMAAMDASTNGLISLTWRSPRITDYTRNDELFSAENIEEMIQRGLLFFIDPPGTNPQVQRDITTYTASTDPRLTERVAVRSLMLSIKFMRNALKRYIATPDGSIATLADIRGGVVQELDRQRANRVFGSYDPSKVSIVQYADRYEAEYEITPLYPINFIVLRVKVSAPIPVSG